MIYGVFPGLELYYTDPAAQRITMAGDVIEHLHRDLSGVAQYATRVPILLTLLRTSCKNISHSNSK